MKQNKITPIFISGTGLLILLNLFFAVLTDLHEIVITFSVVSIGLLLAAYFATASWELHARELNEELMTNIDDLRMDLQAAITYSEKQNNQIEALRKKLKAKEPKSASPTIEDLTLAQVEKVQAWQTFISFLESHIPEDTDATHAFINRDTLQTYADGTGHKKEDLLGRFRGVKIVESTEVMKNQLLLIKNH